MDAIGREVNNAFFFVIDIIISLQRFFINQALGIAYVVLLIAILSAALNYALTGQGLKENIIKILKATVFFFIIITAYPSIVGWISRQTFQMAYGSVGAPVREFFSRTTVEVIDRAESNLPPFLVTGTPNLPMPSSMQRIVHVTPPLDRHGIFNQLLVTRTAHNMTYSVVAPAAVLQIVFLMARDAFNMAQVQDGSRGLAGVGEQIRNIPRMITALFIAGFLIFIGVFALMEYISAFLEFMLVASVGVILFPLSLWEGSKFMAEKYIGAMIGFFIKLLFINIAIFLMIWGFVTMFNVLQVQGITGEIDQIIFVVFTGLLFLIICRAAPGIAQGLLTGVPSLSASGAISTVAGGVAAAAGTMKLAQAAGRGAASEGGAMAGGVANTVSNIAGRIGGAKGKGAAAMAKAIGGGIAAGVGKGIARGAAGLGAAGAAVATGSNSALTKSLYNSHLGKNKDGGGPDGSGKGGISGAIDSLKNSYSKGKAASTGSSAGGAGKAASTGSSVGGAGKAASTGNSVGGAGGGSAGGAGASGSSAGGGGGAGGGGK